MEVYLIFYTSILESYKKSNTLGRIQLPLPYIEVNNHKKFEIEEVLNL